ncbi:MAG TPA: LptF/LptG family permease [Chitinophagaceae bacterium]|nr:LptF/LptG family permease [Chitinophagaceae bacterium]
MFKKLDKLIVKAFIGPFVATFFITLLVLVMQFFWLYIDDFVGKGLGVGVILEFIWYQSATLVPLALPLAVLLSSLMTFGNLGESYELVAIKSAGISLLRFMRPLFILTIGICGIAFLFSNNIMPVANLKSRTMLSDIYYAKPAFNIKEGTFYTATSDFAIKIGKKEQDSILHDVIIYERGGSSLQDNFVVAESAVMSITPNKRFLQLRLRNGWHYQERGNRGDPNTEYIRLGFKEYKKQFDLSSLGLKRTADSVYKTNQRMLSMRQLNKAIDSMERQRKQIPARVRRDVLSQQVFIRYLDSNWNGKAPALNKPTFWASLPDSLKEMMRSRAISQLSSLRINNEIALTDYKERQKSLRMHQIEWHRKISLSLACLVLFMIGAPLGSIIRKGGLGSPLIFSIVFFMVFYFLGTTGEKFAKEGAWQPFYGMWLSTFVLVPVGIFLTYKALRDSQLFSKEFYNKAGRLLQGLKKRKSANAQASVLS